jgi:hypothetical protein
MPTYGPEPLFAGADYVPRRDDKRLLGQFEKVRSLMLDGGWRTLAQIAEATGEPPASVSAQLRHLRKERFGSYRVEKCYCGEGLYRYRLDPTSGKPCQLPLIRRRAKEVSELRQYQGDLVESLVRSVEKVEKGE